nr:MAG TPA: hypothetical protein [Caudoviricetes sp.]
MLKVIFFIVDLYFKSFGIFLLLTMVFTIFSLSVTDENW